MTCQFSLAQPIKAKYQGPRGAHLSCLTETSMYGTVEGTQKSIHHGSGPASTRGRRRGEGRITISPKRTTGPLAKASKELDRRRREFQSMKADDQAACTLPGSMQM